MVEEVVPPEALQQLRQEIDDVDSDLLKLLRTRFVLTRQVGELKAQHRMPAKSDTREREQFEKFARLANSYELPSVVVQKIYREIIDQVVLEHQEIARAHDHASS